MTIYLSGPMSGVNDYREAFEAAAMELTKVGHRVINPAELTQVAPEKALSRTDFLLLDLQLLAAADCMLMMPGWRGSSGCLAEHAFARAVGIEIHEYEPPVPDACPIGGCCEK